MSHRSITLRRICVESHVAAFGALCVLVVSLIMLFSIVEYFFLLPKNKIMEERGVINNGLSHLPACPCISPFDSDNGFWNLIYFWSRLTC